MCRDSRSCCSCRNLLSTSISSLSFSVFAEIDGKSETKTLGKFKGNYLLHVSKVLPHVGVSLNGLFALEDGVRQSFADRETVPSQRDAGLEQVLPRQPAVSFVRHLVTADLPGNGYGQSTCRRETQGLSESVFYLYVAEGARGDIKRLFRCQEDRL